MSDRYYLDIKQPTVLKLEPKQVNDLPNSALHQIGVGRHELAAHIDDIDNPHGHIKFTLKPPQSLGGRNTWYVYKGHATLEEELDRKPEDSKPAISFNQKPVDRGVKIVLPGTGEVVYSNDRIGRSKHFYWYEITHGATRLPETRSQVGAMIRIAEAADEAREKIGKPFHITSGLRPYLVNKRVGGSSQSRHMVGDAIDFYVDGFNGFQLYAMFDPIWEGGLGKYRGIERLCHLDARGYVARWKH